MQDYYEIRYSPPSRLRLQDKEPVLRGRNKSHAAAYAVIAYVTAWLKYYYPAEFIAALIDRQQTSKGKAAYIKIARYVRHAKEDLGLDVLLPSVLKSSDSVTAIDGKTIAESLNTKGVDAQSIGNLLRLRSQGHLNSMDDFYKHSAGINKKAVQSWICIGAFDEFGIVRSQHLAAISEINKRLSLIANAEKRAQASGRKTKITYESKIKLDELLPDISELPDEVKYNLEKAYSGLYLTGHPLDKYQGTIHKIAAFPLSILDYEVNEDTGEIIPSNPNIRNGQSIRCICVISEIFKTQTRKKKEPMAILSIEDKTSIAKALMFPECWAKYKDEVDIINAFQIDGKISMSSTEEPVIFVSSIEKVKMKVTERIIVHCKNPNAVRDAFNYISGFKDAGSTENPVYIETPTMRVLLKPEYWIDKTLWDRYPKLDNPDISIKVAKW